MVTLVLLFFLFFIIYCLSLIEERIVKYKYVLYLAVGIIFIILAGTRPVGFDNDSEHYEIYYNNYSASYVAEYVETSFLVLSSIFNSITSDVHIIFFFYAILGISLKMHAIKKLSPIWFTPLLIYFGNYYVLHDLTKIRAGIVSGLFLCSIPLIAEGKRLKAALIILFGSIFHASALALLPAVFVSNKDMDKKWRIIWGCLLPLGYIIYFFGGSHLGDIPIPYIGDKLASYQNLRDKGIIGSNINVFNAVFLVKCFAYIYLLVFYDTVRKFNKYFPILIRLMGISIILFLSLAFMPVLAFRISELYGIVEIIVLSCIYYTINPTVLGKSVVAIIGMVTFLINAFYADFLHP